MLILVAGATGKMGCELISSSLSRGHTVRGLGRNPSKLPADLYAKLESFVSFENWWDMPILEQASQGVDAVICAYTGIAELQLDAQLLLVRAAERAGVVRYVADSWNYDWRVLPLGTMETYDPYICFRRQVELSSKIKPIYILTGVFTEVFFSFPGCGDFSPRNHGIWDPVTKTGQLYGTGDEKWHFTNYRDAAEYTVEILQAPDAAEGGFFSVASEVISMRELFDLYEKVRGTKAPLKIVGTIEELRSEALEARANLPQHRYYETIGYFYQLYSQEGLWALTDLVNDRFPEKCRTSMEEWLKKNPQA